MDTTLLKLLALASVIACASAVIGKTCQAESECDAGECCQILSEFMVVSRRQLALAPKTGSCQRYKTEGEYCNGFDQMNGYCSCGPNLKCASYKDPNYVDHLVVAAPLKPSNRMMLPGYISTCEKLDFNA